MTTNISETGFNQIRQQIKEYFKTKPEFTDYSFDGSAASVLIDVLAYNSFFTNVHANMAFNETFLDTAVQRSSVVSRAKELGYLPRSKSAAVASIRMSFSVSGNPSQYVLPKNTRFTSTVNGTTYNFVTPVDYIFENSSNTFTKTIDIVQGILINNTYTVNTNDLSQRFIVPNKSADINYLSVTRKNSSSDTEWIEVLKATDLDLADIESDTELFFITEAYDGFYELHFGDNVLGRQLVNNNVIRMDYLITDGLVANEAKTFALSSTLSGVSGVSITTMSVARGGNDKETIDAIKFNAPLSYEAQSRAVTENDYKSIILNRFSDIEDVVVWGGEKNDPPYFGKVYIAVKPMSDTLLTNSQKSIIVNDILSRYNVMGIRPEIADPDYIYVYVNTTVTYNSNIVARSGNSNLEASIESAIETFFNNETNKFGQPLYYSKLVSAIDNSASGIKHSITNLKLERSKVIVDSISTNYTYNFNNAIAPNSVESNGIEIDGFTWFVKDTPSGTSPFTTGILKIYRTSGNETLYYSENIGSVNYNTGEIILSNLKIDDIPSDPVEKLFTITVSQGNIVDPDNPDVIYTDYNVYGNEREDVIALKDSGITITLVADNT